jgi:hypothetical protein
VSTSSQTAATFTARSFSLPTHSLLIKFTHKKLFHHHIIAPCITHNNMKLFNYHRNKQQLIISAIHDVYRARVCALLRRNGTANVIEIFQRANKKLPHRERVSFIAHDKHPNSFNCFRLLYQRTPPTLPHHPLASSLGA